MAMFSIRVLIAIMGTYACGLVYMNRSAMSVAIVSMNTRCNRTENSTVCPDGGGERFEWSETLQGVVLGSQFYLYIFVPTFAGRASDRYGGKWIEFVGVLGAGILAAITPLSVQWFDVTGLIINRTLLGAFHGCIYAALFSLYVKWFPVKECATANGAMVFGGAIGGTIFSALSGYLCATSIGWPLVYYVLALAHLPFLILWFLVATNEPKTNRFISEKEKQYINENVQEKIISKKMKTPWRRMLFSVPVVCSLITKFCSGFGYFLIITKMPSYLDSVLGVPLQKNGNFNAATSFFNGLASLLAPPVANYMILKGGFGKLCVRKLFQSIAMFGPAICMGLIPVMGDNSTACICLLVASMMLYGVFSAGEWTIIREYTPNFAGFIFGYANILAFASGVFAPYFVGLLLDSKSTGQSDRHQWNIVFYVTVAIYVFGGITFLIFGTDQQQDWDREAALQAKKDEQAEDVGSSEEGKQSLST